MKILIALIIGGCFGSLVGVLIMASIEFDEEDKNEIE